MTSGAYHDAMVMGARVPIGMIFVPSAGGISHHPDEYTDARGPRPRRRGARRHARAARGMSADRAHLLAVARGDAEPDLVVEGGRVFSAFTREWLDGDVAIAGRPDRGRRPLRRRRARRRERAVRRAGPDRRARARRVVQAAARPSSRASSSRAARPRVVCDPHELANVLGADGAHWMLDASSGLPLRVYVMAPSCVPASALESPRGAARRRTTWPGSCAASRAIGVAEVMDFPSVIAGDPAVLAKVALHPHVDGHAPGVHRRRARRLRGRRDPLRPRGDDVGGGAREAPPRHLGAAARGVQRAQPRARCSSSSAATGPSTARSAPTTASRTCSSREGHIDAMCRQAVAAGDRAGGRAGDGDAAPGALPRAGRPRRDRARLPRRPRRARRPRVLPRRGRGRRRRGSPRATAPRCRSPRPRVPAWVRDTVHAAPLARRRVRPRARRRARAGDRDRRRAADHRRRGGGAGGARRPRRRRPGARPRQARGDRAPPRDRAASASASCAASGCARGAFASTVAHDAHNIVVVGRRRREHGRLRRAARRARRRDRRRRRRRGPRRAGAAGRGPAVGGAGRGGRRARSTRSSRCCASRASRATRRS